MIAGPAVASAGQKRYSSHMAFGNICLAGLRVSLMGTSAASAGTEKIFPLHGLREYLLEVALEHADFFKSVDASKSGTDFSISKITMWGSLEE